MPFFYDLARLTAMMSVPASVAGSHYVVRVPRFLSKRGLKAALQAERSTG